MDELKPCPFCGGKPERVYKSSGQTTHIECTGCKAQFPKSTMSNRYDEAWNTRVERTCHNTSYRLDESRFHCSECEFGCWVKDASDGRDKPPSYCPNCGAKVVER